MAMLNHGLKPKGVLGFVDSFPGFSRLFQVRAMAKWVKTDQTGSFVCMAKASCCISLCKGFMMFTGNQVQFVVYSIYEKKRFMT